MRHFRCTLALAALGAIASISTAQGDHISMWSRSFPSFQVQANPALEYVTKFQAYRLNYNELKARYDRVPVQQFGPITTGQIIDLPTPDGKILQFKIAEDPIMSAQVAAVVPSKTYRVQGVTDPYMIGRLDTGYNGFNGFIRSPKGDWIITPSALGEKNEYVAYYKRDNYLSRNGKFVCYADEGPVATRKDLIQIASAPGGTLKTYRLAINATTEYTAFYGGLSAAQAGVVTTVNRQNSVYEVDAAIRMTIVLNNPFVGTDPFDNDDGFAMLGQNQTACDANPGDANYDIGHVFSTGGGGVAALNSVGVTGRKAQGVTGSPAPQGDAFDIDYVAHEVGHQYGGQHTFNSTSGACGGGNRTASSAYEVGSGTTIMGYAGICANENVQPNSNAYFHIRSIEQIWAWRDNPSSMGTSTNNGNTAPTVNAGADFTIPQNTPFRLTATATDANNDPLTYCWEQYDLGTSTNDPSQVSDGPIARSFNPSTSPTRFVPRLSNVLSNTNDVWERLPAVDRSMTWRATVRDNRAGGGGYAVDNATITVAGAPFAITAPNTAVNWVGGTTQTVTWNVGGGSVAPNVRILVSTNGGTSYGDGTATVVLASTPNDGSQTITVPFVTSTQCRIIVEAVGNIFYDVSDTNFNITTNTNPAPVLDSISPTTVTEDGPNLTLTANGSNFTASSKVRLNGTDRVTTFVNGNRLTATILASDITSPGTANITVFNPTPGGGTTAPKTLTIVPIAVPTNLTFNPGPGVVSGTASVGTVTISAPAPVGGALIAAVDNSSALITPATVTVPEGQTSANFNVSAAQVAANTNVTVTVTRNSVSRSANLIVVPVKFKKFDINALVVMGKLPVIGKIETTGPAPANYTVNISDNSTATNFTTPQTVPQGSRSHEFTINTIPVVADTLSTVTISRNGQTLSDSVTVLTPVLIGMGIKWGTLKGGLSMQATCSINGHAPTPGVAIALSSDGPQVVVPSSVTVAFNTKIIAWTVQTTVVTAPVTRTITASRNGVTKTRQVTVVP